MQLEFQRKPFNLCKTLRNQNICIFFFYLQTMLYGNIHIKCICYEHVKENSSQIFWLYFFFYYYFVHKNLEQGWTNNEPGSHWQLALNYWGFFLLSELTPNETLIAPSLDGLALGIHINLSTHGLKSLGINGYKSVPHSCHMQIWHSSVNIV